MSCSILILSSALDGLTMASSNLTVCITFQAFFNFLYLLYVRINFFTFDITSYYEFLQEWTEYRMCLKSGVCLWNTNLANLELGSTFSKFNKWYQFLAYLKQCVSFYFLYCHHNCCSIYDDNIANIFMLFCNLRKNGN